MDRIATFPRDANGLLRGAAPFSTRDARPVGCLLIHGFTSTPWDVRACGAFLTSHGIAVEAPLLAGHGTRPEDLADTALEDWLASIEAGYDRLAERVDRVFALGISLAGNFLLTLAPRLPFAGLILIGTPLRFRYERAYRAAYRVLRAAGREYQRKWYVDHLDAAIRKDRPTYDRFPLRCGPDCLRAIERSRATLSAVTCPVFILQSTSDHAVDERTIDEFRHQLGSADVTVRWFTDRYHVLLIDHGSEEAYTAITDFVQSRGRAPAEARPRQAARAPSVPLPGSAAARVLVPQR